MLEGQVGANIMPDGRGHADIRPPIRRKLLASPSFFGCVGQVPPGGMSVIPPMLARFAVVFGDDVGILLNIIPIMGNSLCKPPKTPRWLHFPLSILP